MGSRGPMSAAHKAALGGAAKKGGGGKQEQLQAPIWCPENTCSVSGRGKIEGRSGPREGHAEFEVMGGWKRVDPGCRVDAGMCDCAGLRPLPEHRVQSTGRWGSSLKRGGGPHPPFARNRHLTQTTPMGRSCLAWESRAVTKSLKTGIPAAVSRPESSSSCPCDAPPT